MNSQTEFVYKNLTLSVKEGFLVKKLINKKKTLKTINRPRLKLTIMLWESEAYDKALSGDNNASYSSRESGTCDRLKIDVSRISLDEIDYILLVCIDHGDGEQYMKFNISGTKGTITKTV